MNFFRVEAVLGFDVLYCTVQYSVLYCMTASASFSDLYVSPQDRLHSRVEGA